ncbi:holin [Lactococcus phage GE1]|uniref:Putative holin n=1 Tax=Lactococcus phage GE1 TaxID=1698369 RepID=A0A0N9BAW3_9CAUD|nr:holin [Lactococcus phage GE1]ALA06992.1 putative holin [Lactococcus phage GE1]
MTIFIIKQIALVALMQVLSLVLEYLDTNTLSPTVKKRLAVEGIVFLIYVLGLTFFKGMIDESLITLIGTIYLALVVKKLYVFLDSKKPEIK